MKLRAFFTLVIATLLLGTTNTYAGFIMRKSAPAASSVSVSAEKAELNRAERRAAYSTLKKAVLHEDKKEEHRHRDTSGWEGIVALCCGVVGCMLIFPAIPAIIFGALGLGRHKKNQGLAIAGLVLGILTVFFVAFLAVIIGSMY